VDIAAFPTNAVPNLYTNAMGGAVQMLAINTLGVLYICTNGVEVNSIADLSGKTVYYPEQAPKLVLEYILKENGITDCDLQPSTLDALPGAIASGTSVEIAILPEPKVTVAANQAAAAGSTSFKIALDLSEEWDKVSLQPLVQGCVVVRKSFAEAHPEAVADFLKKYEESINYMKNPESTDAAQLLVDTGILPALPVAQKALPRSNITYMDGEQMKAAASAFIEALGMTVPEGDFFYLGNPS
jgi:NitT/TauT family transport system substrate-binding protein